jgi:peptidoglycan-N-acetylglucosamine deacetylase
VTSCSFLIALYTVIAHLFWKIKKGPIIHATNLPHVLLTFDDGPNPIYTPALLDLLKQYNIKATFFLVAKRAEQYPELVQRIQQEGHTIGIHHYTHKHSFFLTPLLLKYELKKAKNRLEQLTNSSITLYRPTYGHLNAATIPIARSLNLSIMLWSNHFGDWKAKNGNEQMYEQFLRMDKPGAIYLLHDDGSNFGADHDAPSFMLKQLARYLDEKNMQNKKM